MRTKQKELFTTIHVEGAILPPDLLQRIAEGDSELPGLSPADYHLLPGETINEAVNRSWNRLVSAWRVFQKRKRELPESDLGTRITREYWLLHLFRELGYGRLTVSTAMEIDGKSYPISHFWQHTPIHLLGFRVNLDKRTPGVSGAARSSPHSMVQEFLNRSEAHLWAFLSNGLKLRILRDNVSLTRQAYVEFDLEAMMEGEIYSDFVLLWLLCHQSRVEADKPEACWLERWSRAAQEQGTRALEQLRKGVEDAISALGRGFLTHPNNIALRDALRSGELSKQDFYRQILRLVYRLIFLFVAEDRNLLLTPDASSEARDIYNKYYSTTRLRNLAYRMRGSRHSDLYRALRLVMHYLGDGGGCPQLGLPCLGSYLFSGRAIPDIEYLDISNSDFLDAIRSLAFITDGQTLRAVDFKNLGSEEMGSVYESLLELHPEMNMDEGTFLLKVASGHERKTTASYYTPPMLVQELLNSALEPVLEEAARKPDPEKAILELKICDPAAGSGHFLIAAAHRIARKLAAVRTGEDEPPPEALRHALRDVISHCIYGVDLNEMAVELCKVGLWLESLEPGRPLSFLDHRIQCGNSLLGATPALLKKGIPDEAFTPIEGDDKKYCQEYKKRNKQERQTQQTNFLYHEEMPWNRLGDLASALVDIDAIDDQTPEGVARKQEKWEALVKSQGYEYNYLRADAWCAAFVWRKIPESRGGLPYPITEEAFHSLEKNPFSVPQWMKQEIKRLRKQYKFFHWHLAFPDVFRVPGKGEQADNPHTGWSGGFDVVLGNPPWERIKLQEKEWFAERHPAIANAPNASVRKKMIEELKETDPDLFNQFLEAKRQAEGESILIRHTGRYPLCGRGDVNTYAVFAELNRHLINRSGAVGCIVPSGIATDDTTKYFFQDLMEKGILASLYDFENRKKIFPAIDSRMKFCLLTLRGPDRPQKRGADFVFFALDTSDLREAERHFALTAEDIALLNPNTRTCPIFRSKKDAELTKYIYRRMPVLINEQTGENPWGIKFMRMFDMSNDSHLFRTREQLAAAGFQLQGNIFVKGEERWLPLYEAKMIHQFNHRFGDYRDLPKGSKSTQLPIVSLEKLRDPTYVPLSRYWVAEEEVEKRIEENWKHRWLIGFRDITNTTNERTTIFTLIPRVAIGNKVPIIFSSNLQKELILLSSSASSFGFDFVARQSMGGTTLNFFIVKQLAFLSPTIYLEQCPWLINYYSTTYADWFYPRVLELTYTAWDLQPFARDCGYDGPPFKWDEERRFLLRCELDAAFFHLYLGMPEEWQAQGSSELLRYFPTPREAVAYIMETFPIVKRKDEAKYGEYRTKRVILEIYDEMAEAIRTGNPYQTRLDPPPADPRVAHGYHEEKITEELIRLYTLLCAAELAKQPRKTYIVKILYIAEACKRVKLKYPWKIRQYGPYPEGNIFDSEITSLQQKGIIEKPDVFSQVWDRPIKISSTGRSKRRELEEKYSLQEVKDAIGKIISDFEKYGSKDMELRATLIYLHKNNPSWDFEDLKREFIKIKEKKFHEHEIEEAYIELVQKGYIAEP